LKKKGERVEQGEKKKKHKPKRAIAVIATNKNQRGEKIMNRTWLKKSWRDKAPKRGDPKGSP